MNTNSLNSLPQYIFQNKHDCLENVNQIIENQNDNSLENKSSEVSEYPIEFYQNQQHVVNKYLSSKYQYVHF
jgi:hypothetical protein